MAPLTLFPWMLAGLSTWNKADPIVDMSCYARIFAPLGNFYFIPLSFQFSSRPIMSLPRKRLTIPGHGVADIQLIVDLTAMRRIQDRKRHNIGWNLMQHIWGTKKPQMQIKLKTCPQKTCPFLECSDPVLKENVRRELIPYSEQLWNLELTPPSNLLSDSKSSVTKSYDISLQCIWSLLWISKYIKKKKVQEFRLEICQPCRLSRSNDFWSGKRNWFHYFQIIRQQLLELNFTENGRKSLSRKISHFKSFAVFVVNLIQEQQF